MTPAGLEPAASGLGIPRSILLSYGAVVATLLRSRSPVQNDPAIEPRHFDSRPVSVAGITRWDMQTWQDMLVSYGHAICSVCQAG